MEQSNWISIQVRRELLYSAKAIMATDAAKEAGLYNVTRFIDLAVREMLVKFRQKSLSHVNMYENHVKIMDRGVGRVGRIVSVYFKENSAPVCDYCDDISCLHVVYAMTIPGVRSATDGRNVRLPQDAP